MHSPLLQRLFTAFAMLALVVLLAVGGGFRYLCYCTGETIVTVHERCDGHHDEHSHHEDHPADQDGHEDHDHELVKTSTDLHAPSSAGAPELKWHPLPWTPLVAVVTSVISPAAVEATPLTPPDDPPPPSVLVARSVVFLI